MDQQTRLLGIYVLVSLVVFCACIGTWIAYNNSKKPTPVPTVTQPAKSQSAAPVKAQSTPPQQRQQPAAQPVQATPQPHWTVMPGTGGLIKYRVEPLKKP